MRNRFPEAILPLSSEKSRHISPEDILQVYKASVRSILEYANGAWSNHLSVAQSIDIEVIRNEICPSFIQTWNAKKP